MRVIKINRRETARKLLRVELEKLPLEERLIVERFISRGRIARDVMREFDAQLTFGERLADRVAGFGGSWTFILLFIAFLIGWMIFNSLVLARHAFDPYPYILLNLVLSCLAALQAPVIMMNQNRAAEKDRMQAQNDYEVNVKAELEILQLQEKLNELREHDWVALVEMQQRQIELLERVLIDGRCRSAVNGVTEN
ncbi:MAG TPA: DUF1003 domain-containing protein [Blastocatellia bacterium]|nr:DUF1003 domain-containing protein [Blastocatellia bacterium]